MSAVVLKGVSKVFPDGTRAVDGVSLDVAPGELLVLLGPSGCGKSTVLRMVAGLEDPTDGEIFLDGEPAGLVSVADRRIAMVFQDFALYPHMTVRQNIGFPLRMAGMSPTERDDHVTDVAASLGILDVLDRRPHQLSGGQRQRVAMGRAIVRRPQVFLMDEPLSNLDSGLRAELRAEISGLVRSLGVTTLYVTHDQTEALTMADRVAILRRGVLQQVGTPTAVYEQPATLYVALFLGTPRMSVFEAQVRVSLDRYVALDLGQQELRIPWDDYRVRGLMRRHGERVVVGLRAEALRPVNDRGPTRATAAQPTENVLQGRLRHIEHHGHELLAHLDIGAVSVRTDTISGDSTAASTRLGGLRGAFARLGGRAGRPAADHANPAGRRESVFIEPGRRQRPADLVVRLAAHSPARLNQPLSVAVDLSSLHLFDGFGDRLDLVRWV